MAEHNDKPSNISEESQSAANIRTVRQIGNYVLILGTIHIAKESAQAVRDNIEVFQPDVVMIELDERRLAQLKEKGRDNSEMTETISNQQFHKEKGIRRIESHEKGRDFSNAPSGIYLGFDDLSLNSKAVPDADALFNSLGGLQEMLGELLGIQPGIEMIAAIQAVERLNIPLILIDQPADITFQRLVEIQTSSKTETNQMMGAIEEMRAQITDDDLAELMGLLQDPLGVSEFLQSFHDQYPMLSKILITERNDYMAARITEYVSRNPGHRVMVVCGAGHLEAIVEAVFRAGGTEAKF